MNEQPTVSAAELAGMFSDARQRTLELVSDLTDEQLIGPALAIVNPLLWEIGHVAWFQEKWVLRHLRGEEPVRSDSDALYDSIAIPHDDRWDLPLLSRQETLEYMRKVHERILEGLQTEPLAEQDAYFHQLVLFHEDMHAEAFTYTRQTLGYPVPPLGTADADQSPTGAGALDGDVEVPGGIFLLGAALDLPFVFDNEKWAHSVEVKPFSIARASVSNAQFAEFVEAGGYRGREFWSDAGWTWRVQAGAERPVYWESRSGDGWRRRQFDQMVPLPEHLPVIHVNWHEAEAFCRWAGRRLPTEAEWELAAAAQLGPDRQQLSERKRQFPWGDFPPDPQRANMDGRALGCLEVAALPEGDSFFGCRQMIGNVWEWTASDFEPFPGFVPDPYKEYSQPWFGGTHKVLRGGAWATRSRLIRNTWRNYYTPDRRDVLAGFRTCAVRRP